MRKYIHKYVGASIHMYIKIGSVKLRNYIVMYKGTAVAQWLTFGRLMSTIVDVPHR